MYTIRTRSFHSKILVYVYLAPRILSLLKVQYLLLLLLMLLLKGTKYSV